MQTEDLAKIGFGVVVVLAIIGGIVTVGGPATGRMEKRDQARLSDIRALQNYVTCVARARDKTLPDSLDGNNECRRELDRTDPFDGTPYVYRKLSETSYELCANFELPDALSTWQRPQLDPETGCLQYEFIP
ncbi:type II secretion system protein [Actibacterium pelagium]|uniref:Uncharacterized protein n=1 Tax=Actibacterium pelagium TaxID=2029103 RepID=A0A917EL21_9RHOB|nr:hypothetical protein [Actibacterium pelagium]GGE58870.1 hypothetical protein GCM10011517_28170 [Actibacterium pelagium]